MVIRTLKILNPDDPEWDNCEKYYDPPSFEIGETVCVETCSGYYEGVVKDYKTSFAGELLYYIEGPDIITNSSKRHVYKEDSKEFKQIKSEGDRK